MMDTDYLLQRAFDGAISAKELDEVAKTLTTTDQNINRYPLILILGKAFASRYAPLVAKYLDSPKDPMLARVALSVLCSYFGLAPNYRNQILAFCNGIEWDRHQDVRLLALSVAGEYLKDCRDAELAGSVLNAFKEGSASDGLLKRCAYQGMLYALGMTSIQIVRLMKPRDNPQYDEAVVIDFARMNGLTYS